MTCRRSAKDAIEAQYERVTFMTTHDLLVRTYRPDDTPELSAIWFAASLAAHGFLTRERLEAQRQLVEEVYLPGAETWVACSDGRPVGFIGLMETYIGGLFVDPDQQGKGIGRALVDHAARRRSELMLGVYALNTGAIRFYESLGFVETDRLPVDDAGLPFETITLKRQG